MKRFTFSGVQLRLFITWLLLLPTFTVAQTNQSTPIRENEYVVEREFTTENGLPGNGINGMYQDNKGYIWAATYNGLVRYNGIDFKTFNSNNVYGLESNRFTAVSQDYNGTIWAGLEQNGFVKIDVESDSVTTFKLDQESLGINIKTTTFEFLPDNTPWIGTSVGLLTQQNGEIKFIDGLPNETINHITFHDGHLYVEYMHELIKLDPENFSDVETIVELRSDTVYFKNDFISGPDEITQLMDFHFHDGDLYLMTESGLIRYGEQAEWLFTRDEVNQAALNGFLPHEDILYVYGRDGIFSTDLSVDEFRYYNRMNVIDLMIDHEGSLWAASLSNGIVQFISTPVFLGEDFDRLDNQGITAILMSRDGSVYVGANCDGIYKFDGNNVQRFGSASGLENECIWSLMEDDNGRIWAGTWGGGVHFSERGSDTFQRYTPEILDGTDIFLSIFEDSDGTMWFGTYSNGLFKLSNSEVLSVKDNEGETLSAVRMIYESNKGDIYVATDDGIGVLSGNEIEILDELNILKTSNFRTIAQDSHGRFYFGSYGGGLLVYEPGEEPVTITTDDGLFDNTVSQLAFDGNNNLWMGGNLGVAYIEKSEIGQFLEGWSDHLRVSRLGVEEGMTIRETNGGFMPSSQFTDDGRLLIPTVQGVNVFDTNRMSLNRIPPNVTVEQAEVDGTTYSLGQIKSIPYSTQRLVFRFSGLSFENPENNQYEYMLEGFDKNWIRAGNTNQAIYSSIPAGEYNLKVRASNNDGYWNTNEASFSFSVVPPFWQTTWFYLLVFLGVGILIIGGFRYRVRNIKKNNRQLQRMVAERTQELSVSNRELKKHIEDKNKLQSILAHDLRNPFTAIIGYIELIKDEFENKGDNEQVEMMNMLLDSGRNTLSLLENLLQWSGSKEGGLEASFEAIDVTQLVEEAISMTDAQSAFKNIFVRNLIEDSHFVWADRNMILSVIRNLLSNAIKFSGRDSIVEISLNEKDEKVIISVEDFGVGIPEDEVNTIFSAQSKIQQKVGTQGEKGIGMGLLLCKEFIEKHDEQIWVTSTPKQGSTFSFSLSKVMESEHHEINIDQSKE